jgi:hypothetical protein
MAWYLINGTLEEIRLYPFGREEVCYAARRYMGVCMVILTPRPAYPRYSFEAACGPHRVAKRKVFGPPETRIPVV